MGVYRCHPLAERGTRSLSHSADRFPGVRVLAVLPHPRIFDAHAFGLELSRYGFGVELTRHD